MVVLTDIPGLPMADPPSCAMAGLALLRRPCTSEPDRLAWQQWHSDQVPVHEALRVAAATRPGTLMFDPASRLCTGDRCLTALDGHFLYRDSVHWRRNMAPDTQEAMIRRSGLDEMLSAGSGVPPRP